MTLLGAGAPPLLRTMCYMLTVIDRKTTDKVPEPFQPEKQLLPQGINHSIMVNGLLGLAVALLFNQPTFWVVTVFLAAL